MELKCFSQGKETHVHIMEQHAEHTEKDGQSPLLL